MERKLVKFDGLQEIKFPSETSLRLEFKSREQMREALMRMGPLPDKEEIVSQAFYFGTFREAGHYLWRPGMRKSLAYQDSHPIPWKQLDGSLYPKGSGQGECLRHHKEGWTCIAFANNTDDRRGGSNSGFFFDARLDFDQCVNKASEIFPQVVERFSFPLVEVTEYRNFND